MALGAYYKDKSILIFDLLSLVTGHAWWITWSTPASS